MRIARIACVVTFIVLSAASGEARHARLIRRPPTPLTSRSLLWIAPHPDDEVLIAPLLAERCIAASAQCTFLVLTRGEAGECLLPGGCNPDLATVRTHEMEASAASFGATLMLWDFDDGGGDADGASWSAEAGGRGALVRKLAEAIDQVRPDIVLTFEWRHGTTCHVDHRALGLLVEEALLSLGERAPRGWALETVATITSPPLSIAFAPATSGVTTFDANAVFAGKSGWDWLLDTVRLHPSQFDDSWTNALESMPPEQRAVFLMPLRSLAREAIPFCFQ